MSLGREMTKEEIIDVLVGSDTQDHFFPQILKLLYKRSPLIK